MDRKEAIEIVRKNYPHVGFSGSEFESALRELVPEFKEQPDPRHSLIEFIKWSCDRGSITPEQRKNVDFWLAYLERQKKQTTKTDACGFPIRDKGESACSYLERCLAPDMRHIWYEACAEIKERQKDKRELDFAEGKVEGVQQTCQEIKDAMSLFEPKDLTPFEFTFRDYIDSAIRYCVSGEGYQQYIKEWAADLLNLERLGEHNLIPSKSVGLKEQQPAQFKGGSLAEIIKGEFEGFRRLLKKKGIDYEPQSAYWENFARLFDSSAREYLKEQQPAEWSEEDEAALGDLMWCIEQARKSAKDENDMGNIWYAEHWLENRFKSLRPQPHWKPSDEQIDTLEAVVGMIHPTDTRYDAVFGLLDELKAL